MKTSHRIKILPLGVLTAIALTFSHLSLAAPFSEKHAFCSDRIPTSNSNYLNQKIYNRCMKNADALIEQLEQEIRYRNSPEYRERRREEQKKLDKEFAEREAKRKAKRKAVQKSIKKYDDLFDKFK